MPRSRLVFWILTALCVTVAFGQAWALRWTCDDAFISMRYAEHLVDGHGLVFNRDPNEAPVEGYTNFAWTMWLAVGMAVGFGGEMIASWASFWGAVAHAGTVLLLAVLAWRASGGRAVVPIAACGYAVLHHAASLAPAGLETAMFALLVTALLSFAIRLRCARAARLAGFVGVLLAMTRPDGGLFVAITGCFVLFDAWQRRAPRLLLAYVLPFLVCFVPYLLWRRLYYGYWVPNTFYAKSASDPYPSQGLVYVWEFVKCYWVLLATPLLPLVYALKRPDLAVSVSPWLGRRPHLAIVAFVGLYVAFVIWVGGDFMFGRFLVPVLPALLLGLDVGANRWLPRWPQVVLAAGLVAGLLLRVEPPWLGKHPNPFHFSDNRAITLASSGLDDLTWSEAMRLTGERLHDVFDGLDVRIAIVGSQANLAYRTQVPVAIECATGLTDARIAHQEVAARGVPGHEKGYRRVLDYIIEERGVQITFDRDYRVKDLTDGWRDVWFEVPGLPTLVPARLMRYDRALMQALHERDYVVVFTPIDEKLDEYLAGLAGKDRKQVRKDYAALRRYYFDQNDDPERQARFEEFLQ